MEDKVGRYIQAGARENTRRSYQGAIEHFEVHWGGFLPATADAVAQYLATYAGVLSISTLKQRLSALAQWHISQGFPDPTKAPVIRQVLRGIRRQHPSVVQQAKPLMIEDLEKACDHLSYIGRSALAGTNPAKALRAYRNRALLLMGFWRGFRGDELCRLQIEHIHAHPEQGMDIFLPYSKTDTNNLGSNYQLPALRALCPVQAYLDWLQVSDLKSGAVFRSISQWGKLGEESLHAGSLINILKCSFQEAGIQQIYTGHSLRRGFATWATANGWDLKALMSYVGWKDSKSALRYIDSGGSFGNLALPKTSSLASNVLQTTPKQLGKV